MALGDLTQSLAADPTYGTSDPETIKRKQLLAAALMNQGMSTEPIRSPWQGAANLAKALIGGYQGGAADREAQAGRQSVLPDLNTAIQPRAVTTPSQAMTTADATPGTNYRDAISSVESGGKYDAIGPDTGGDRAYGRYQVMGANIPAWTKAALGREMTPQEFLADPKAQDATFDHRFGQYVQQYGNPQDAASMWFSGRPMAKAGNASDVLGTTVPGYVAKFNAALGKPQGTQVASADPSFAPQSNQPDFSGAPMPPPRPDDIEGGLPNSVRPVAQFTNAPVADATDATDGEDKPAPAQMAQAAPAAAQSPMADPRVAAAYRVASNPWATPAQQQIAMTIIKDAMNPKEKYSDPYMDAKGNYVQRGPDGAIKVLQSAKDATEGKNPATVQEYNFYKDQTEKSGGTPLPFLEYQKQKAAHFADNNYTPEMIDSLVAQKAAGLPYPPGLARSMPGLIAAAEASFAKRYPADEGASKVVQNKANNVGMNQEQRTLGAASANNTLYGNVASNTLASLINASREVPRSSWVPINKLIQMGEGSISDPALARFRTAVMTTANDYAKATTPTGQPTDSQRAHAYDVLNTATGPEAVEAIANMMHQEIANTHRGIKETKESLRAGQHGELPPINVAPAGPQTPGSQSLGIVDTIKSLVGGKPSAPAAPSNPVIDQARAAIARGAPRDAVIKRLRDNGIDPGGL